MSQHVHHLHLENRVDGLYTNAGTTLGHGENIHHAYREVVDELSQHQTHDFHGNTSTAVSQHLEEGKGGDVDGLGVVDKLCVVLQYCVSISLRGHGQSELSRQLDKVGCSYRSGLAAQATEALGLEHVPKALHCVDVDVNEDVEVKCRAGVVEMLSRREMVVAVWRGVGCGDGGGWKQLGRGVEWC